MKKEEILKKLRETEDYISGQELCEYYGVSRTAVWKAIKQLEKDGYCIEALTNRGYKLIDKNVTENDVMSQVSIESYIDTKWAGKNFVFNKETGSTNQDVKALAGGSGSSLGTGGMITKIRAAEIATNAGCDMIIANGAAPEILYDIVEGKSVGTRFMKKQV